MMRNSELFNVKYDCVFSMGALCFCAEMLIKSRLRVFSSPYDWLAYGGFKTRLNFLCNNFENFINVEDLEKIGECDEPEKCNIYRNNQTGIVFNHDFPKGKLLKEGYPQVIEKYNRRIKNLFERIKKSKNVLIVYMDLERKANINTTEIVEVMDKVNKKFENVNINLLYICSDEEMAKGRYTIDKLAPNTYVVELNNIGPYGRYGDYSNCKKLLSKVKLRKKLKDMLFKIGRAQTRTRVYLFGVKIMSFKRANDGRT